MTSLNLRCVKFDKEEKEPIKVVLDLINSYKDQNKFDVTHKKKIVADWAHLENRGRDVVIFFENINNEFEQDLLNKKIPIKKEICFTTPQEEKPNLYP